MFHTSAADDAVDLAAEAGLFLDDWQEYVLRGSLGERVDGKWSAFRVGLVVPRQNGKNAILEARELAGAILFGEELIMHTAHQFATSKNSLKQMIKRIKFSENILETVQGYKGDPDNVPGIRTGNNDPGITFKNGNAIRYATRGKDGGRGFTGDLIILDEAYALRSAEMGALVPTLASNSMEGNPQIWFTSSAGMVDSDELESLRKSGMEGKPRLAYYEWSAPDDAENDDRDAWYVANPSLGIRMSEEYVEDELDTLVKEGDDEEFKRERLGIWARLGGESFIPAKLWSDARGDVEFSPKIAFAVDVPPERDRAVIAAASMDEDGKVSVEVVDAAEGTEWVATALSTLQGMHNPVTTVIDAGGAAGVLIKDLRRERVKLTQLQYRAYGQACGAFLDLVNQGKLTHSGQTELDRAADAARQSMMGDTLWKWSRKDVEADISPLVAVTLAVHGVLSRNKSSDKRKVVMV